MNLVRVLLGGEMMRCFWVKRENALGLSFMQVILLVGEDGESYGCCLLAGRVEWWRREVNGRWVNWLLGE